MSDTLDWNAKTIAEFRANEGRVGGNFEGAPMVLVHHRGRTSGREYVNPVMYLPHDTEPDIIYVFATKPRLLPSRFGIVDTLRATGHSGHVETTLLNTAGDQYASMPSLHVAWAVWCALALYPVVRRRALRALVVAYPVMTTLVVVTTGNHFFLDTIAGALLASAVWAGVTRTARRVAARTPGNAAPVTTASRPPDARPRSAAPGPGQPTVPWPRAGDRAARRTGLPSPAAARATTRAAGERP